MTETLSVEVLDLTKQFGRFVAVDHISFKVYDGEIFGFLGANGAGKTTTIKMLCGLMLPSSGQGWVEGLDIYSQTEAIKQSLGYMSQKFSLYDDLTVQENLSFYGGVYGMAPRQLVQACERTIVRMGLQPYLKRMTRELPTGWKQRLALSCAILHEPKILFLDEPTGGVDPISRRQFWQIIYQLAEMGTTVFVTTHYMDEAEYCNRLSIMHEGRIIALGSPQALKDQYQLATMEQVFIHLVNQAGLENRMRTA